LHRCLDGGRSFDAVSLEAKLRNNEKLISHQNIQIEFLQEKNHELEKRIQQLMDSKQDGLCEKFKNDELVRDIKEMNRIARKAEIEKQMVASQADRELEQAKYEIARSRDEINSMDSAVHQLELEKQNIANEMLTLRGELEHRRNEIANLHDIIDKIQDDKAKLSKKIAKFLENGKYFCLTINFDHNKLGP
jgi:centrosomal protein CEP135